MALEISVLGAFEVRDETGAVVAFCRPLAARFVRLMLVAGGEWRSADDIGAALWPQRSPQDARPSLHVVVHRARAAIGTDRIVRGAGGYRLALRDGDHVDAASFSARAHAALAQTGPERRHALDAALSQWRGEPYLDDRYEDWAWSARTELSELRRMCQADLVEALLDGGESRRAVLAARALVAGDDLDEQAHVVLIRALAAAGRPEDALAQLAQCRRTLHRRLGCALSARTVAAARLAVDNSAA
jgi:DNA-binding SARP family transcriptional activator